MELSDIVDKEGVKAVTNTLGKAKNAVAFGLEYYINYPIHIVREQLAIYNPNNLAAASFIYTGIESAVAGVITEHLTDNPSAGLAATLLYAGARGSQYLISSWDTLRKRNLSSH